MNTKEKAEFEKEFGRPQNHPPLPLALMPVSDPIEQVMKFEVSKEIAEESRAEISAQLEEAGEELHLSYPYYTDILETGIDYETTGWLIIYGIEVVEGVGSATMSFERQEILWLVNHERRNYISPKGIIVPELTAFRLDAETKMKYRLVGEGNNTPKIEVHEEKTYIRTQKKDEN